MSRTAPLAMDFQVAHLNRMPGDYLPLATRALDRARASDIPVIHVALRLRADHVDVHPRNKMFGALPRPRRYTSADPVTAIHPDVAPRGSEIVVHQNPGQLPSLGNNLHQILINDVYTRDAVRSPTVDDWVIKCHRLEPEPGTNLEPVSRALCSVSRSMR